MLKDFSKEVKENTMYKNQPGVVLKMHAKPGMVDALFELTTNLHYNGDPDGPVDWALCQPNDEPDTLWAFEFYRDEESFTRHYSNPAMDEGHEKVLDLLADMPLRADVHIIASSCTSETVAYAVKEKSMYKNQPGVVLRMHAKPEMSNALFELTTNLHYNGDPDGPVDWVLCQPNDEPDTLWAFEFYRDEESFTRHYSNPAMDEGHEKVLDLLADMPLRADVHIIASSCTSETVAYAVKEKSMYKNQPGVVLRMHAKPEMGNALFELTTNLHYNGDPDGPVDWVLCQPNDEPDTLWAFEFYRDEESFTRHYSNPAMDEGHKKVLELLAAMPMRADVHIVVSSCEPRA